MKYELLNTYPGLPDNYRQGTILYKYTPIVGFTYYSDVYDKHRIDAKIVEHEPLWFKKVE